MRSDPPAAGWSDDPVKLNAGSLEQVARRIPASAYERSSIGTGILHFGVGGFHRAHQAMYVDTLLNAGTARDWGICGVGVMPADREMQTALREQDYLYTLVQKHSDGRYEPQVIGSIVDYL